MLATGVSQPFGGLQNVSDVLELPNLLVGLCDFCELLRGSIGSHAPRLAVKACGQYVDALVQRSKSGRRRQNLENLRRCRTLRLLPRELSIHINGTYRKVGLGVRRAGVYAKALAGLIGLSVE